MGKQQSKRQRATEPDKGYQVMNHRCTVNTAKWLYQVVLYCKDLKDPVVVEPKSAAKFTAVTALLNSGQTVYYWPVERKVGINTTEEQRGPRRRKE